MESFEELAARRKESGVPLLRIQRRLNCSYSWLRDLEAGYHHGIPAVARWKRLYIGALNDLVKEREELKELCR